MRITLRLNEEEAAQLVAMTTSENASAENKSEFFRMLLAREWNRRKGIGKPKAEQFQTAFGVGRPVGRTIQEWMLARHKRSAS